jgi:hypothetical protein
LEIKELVPTIVVGVGFEVVTVAKTSPGRPDDFKPDDCVERVDDVPESVATMSPPVDTDDEIDDCDGSVVDVLASWMATDEVVVGCDTSTDEVLDAISDAAVGAGLAGSVVETTGTATVVENKESTAGTAPGGSKIPKL